MSKHVTLESKYIINLILFALRGMTPGVKEMYCIQHMLYAILYSDTRVFGTAHRSNILAQLRPDIVVAVEKLEIRRSLQTTIYSSMQLFMQI